MIAAGEEPRLTRLAEGLVRTVAASRADPLASRVVAGAVAMLVAAFAGIAMAGRSFLPEFNEGALTVSAVTIPGTSLADSNALGDGLERLC